MNVQQLLLQAKQAEEDKQWARAVELYSKVLEEAPAHQLATEQLGWCLSRAKEYERAIGILQELAQSQPQSAKWPYMIGYQYQEQEQWREAIKWYDQSLDINSDYVVVLYRKGYSHFKLGQVVEALRAFERCRALWRALPEGPNKERDRKSCMKAAYHQAEILIENPRKFEGAFEGAIRLLGELISLERQDSGAYYLLGKALLESGQADQAIAAFQESERLQPNQDYVLDRWGQALARLKRYEEAEKIYQRIPTGQRKGYVLRNLGEMQLEMGNYQRATATLKQSLQKDPRNHYGHYYLGLCYKKTGEWGLAVRELHEAIRLRRKCYNVDYPEAKREIESILSEHPEAATAPTPADTRHRGKVIRYKEDRGYGFIQGDDGAQIFFHIKDFPRGEKVEVGIQVEYEEGLGDRGPKALRIKCVYSDNWKSSRG